MAAFDFPSSPNVNDIYTLNGVAFMWNGSVWKRYSTSTGAQGFQGAAGAVGAQGAQGTNGTIGSDGAQGAQGHQGAAGNAGSTGAQGAAGATGAQGAAGAQGAPFDRSEYNYTASGGQTAFAAAYANASDVDVFMNGVRLTPAEYTPSGGTTITLASGATAGDIIDILTFASAGPTGAQGAQGHQGDAFNRSESNFTATSGQTSFAPSGGYTNGDDLDVFVNGVRLTPADYTATNGTNVVLDVGANTGDIVDIIYYEAAGPAGAQGAAGAAGIAGTITFSTSAPSNPIMGDLWYDTDDGAFAGYYNDGNTSQWIDLSGGPRGAQGADGAQGATGSIPSNITAVNGTFSGNVSIAGTLTYEDVTNIDSVGVITASSGIHITGTDEELRIYRDQGDRFGGLRYTGSLLKLRLPAADHFTVDDSSNNERLRISSTGQIGMGKAGSVVPNGNSPLTIQESDSNSETICLRATNSGGNGSQPGIVMKTAGGGHIGGIYCDVNSDYMRLSTSGTDRVTITNTGNIGINEATPDRTLHVNSGSTDTALKLESTDAEVSLELADNTGSSYIGGGGNYLNFYSGGNERIRVDSSGCLRVGNTHSQTTSGQTKRIALGAKANIWGWTSGNINGALTLADNYYWDGTNNRAIEADEAAYLTLRSGTLRYGTTDSTPSAGGVTGLTEKFRVDTSGNLLLGQGHTAASDLAGGFTKRLAIEGTSAANSSIGLTRNANDDNPPYIYLGKSRGTSAGSNTVIGNGDTIGMVNFAGSRGSGAFGDAVNLRAYADANFSGSSSPGRFSVWTTPANSTSPLESFQVNSAGAITAPRNVSWSYSRSNNGASWGSSSGLTYGGRQYRSPLPLFGASGTNYDTHNALSTFTSGGGTGIRFTAPVGGKYLVMLNMTSVKNHNNSDWGSIGLMRNDTSQASTGSLDYMLDTIYFPDSTSTGNQLGWGNSVIINLSQNDYIVPYTMSVEHFSSDNQFYFQGYLLG